MSVELTDRKVEYVRAWVLALESAVPDDRRLTALFAMAALGNLPVVRCASHRLAGKPMTFTAAYRHMTDMDAPTGLRCALVADLAEVQR
jgi:hypothetical protein